MSGPIETTVWRCPGCGWWGWPGMPMFGMDRRCMNGEAHDDERGPQCQPVVLVERPGPDLKEIIAQELHAAGPWGDAINHTPATYRDIAQLIADVLEGEPPPQRMRVSEWLEKNRELLEGHLWTVPVFRDKPGEK